MPTRTPGIPSTVDGLNNLSPSQTEQEAQAQIHIFPGCFRAVPHGFLHFHLERRTNMIDIHDVP